jgi:hypothetical protein
MMGAGPPLGRRAWLGTVLAWALLRPSRAVSQVEARRGSFDVRATILYGLFRLDESGTIEESIDRAAGRYEVRVRGQGAATTSEIDATGTLRHGRWTPLSFRDRLVVHGRESRLEIVYDHDRRVAEYRGRSETFLLRRRRVVDDVVALPAGVHVDDVVSASLNYAEGRWPPEPDGTLVTRVVRRRRPPREQPDDVQRTYRAEVVPFTLRVATEDGGRSAATFDMTRFTSWAREEEPARIVFGQNRRPERITATLMLGTSVAIHLGPAPAPAS